MAPAFFKQCVFHLQPANGRVQRFHIGAHRAGGGRIGKDLKTWAACSRSWSFQRVIWVLANW